MVSFLSQHAVVLAAILLLLGGGVAARQLDDTPKHEEHDDKVVSREAGRLHANDGLSQPHRSLTWGRTDSRYDDGGRRESWGREYNSYPNQAHYETHDSKNYGAAGEHDADRAQEWSDAQQHRGYDKQGARDTRYYGSDVYDRQRAQDVESQGYDRQQMDESHVRGYDRIGERDEAYRNYDGRMEERDQPSYRTYDEQEVRDRGYVQYGSNADRQYNDRGEMYQQYSRAGRDERDQASWQRADSRWQQDSMLGPYHDGHGHGIHDEGATPTGNGTVEERTHCAQHKPSDEEKSNLQNLLSEAASWWEEFSDEILAWLEEHGNVVYDWLEENIPEILNDGVRQDTATAASNNKFNARVKVYWTAIVPNNGSVDGYDGHVSLKDVESQMKVLNTAYEGTGFQFVLESFKSVKHTPAEFTACSEDKDPNSAKIKQTYRKGDATDLYIYTWHPVCAGRDLLGWATFPESYTKSRGNDGVVLLYTTLPGGKSKAYGMGMTAVHEVGHWLGLYHTFEGHGCDDKVNDAVDDTPVQFEETSGCPTSAPDTCPNQKGLDPIHNYMDYSDDICLTQFTKGQIERMQNAWKLRVKMSQQA